MALCRSLLAEALQAAASEGLTQGPYVAAGAIFEPTINRSKGIVYTKATPRSKRPFLVDFILRIIAENYRSVY